MDFLRNLFGKKRERKVFRLTQEQLVNFMAQMKANGFSLDDKTNQAAAMMAITGLGYHLPNNVHIIDKTLYQVSMEDQYIVVTFQPGALK